jgi:hypothetical protein
MSYIIDSLFLWYIQNHGHTSCAHDVHAQRIAHALRDLHLNRIGHQAARCRTYGDSKREEKTGSV